MIRKGIAFLEPKSVVVKGSLVDELDASQDSDFVKGLNRRLG
jgi:RecQ-mediated genome instability protein 1